MDEDQELDEEIYDLFEILGLENKETDQTHHQKKKGKKRKRNHQLIIGRNKL